MKKSLYFTLFKYISLVLWVSALVYVYPLPNNSNLIVSPSAVNSTEMTKLINEGKITKKEIERAENIENTKRISIAWSGWAFRLIFILFGIFSSILLFKEIENWQYFMGLSSILYLTWWSLVMLELSAVFNRSILDTYILNFTNYVLLGSPMFSIYKDFLHPIFHVGVITFMLYKFRLIHPTKL